MTINRALSDVGTDDTNRSLKRTIRPIKLVTEPLLRGSHLQTTRLTFRKDHPDVSGLNPTNVLIPVNDGTGDQLTGIVHTPENQRYPGLIVVAGHGYGGDVDSVYMRWLTQFFFEQDVAVLRLNWRGAGSSRLLCKKDYHPGSGEDLLRVWDWLLNSQSDQLPTQFTHTYFCGTSLSGCIVANALAKLEDGAVAPAENFSGVLGATGICLLLDMEHSIRTIHSPSNWPYLQYLLGKIKLFYENHPAMPDDIKAKIANTKTIMEIDEIWTAPQEGYPTAFELYKHTGSMHWLPKVKRSMRVIATMDDPWIKSDGFLGCDWSNPLLEPRMFDIGGHCGLWEKGFHYQRQFREARDHLWGLIERLS